MKSVADVDEEGQRNNEHRVDRCTVSRNSTPNLTLATLPYLTLPYPTLSKKARRKRGGRGGGGLDGRMEGWILDGIWLGKDCHGHTHTHSHVDGTVHHSFLPVDLNLFQKHG